MASIIREMCIRTSFGIFGNPAEKGCTYKSFISLAKQFRGRVPCQLRCGEEFLAKLPGYLGIRDCGCLFKGDNFGIRILNEEKQKQPTKPYQAMGELFAERDGFIREEAKEFTGPEYFPLLMQFIFKTFAKKMFQKAAASWRYTVPLDEKIWETNSAYKK